MIYNNIFCKSSVRFGVIALLLLSAATVHADASGECLRPTPNRPLPADSAESYRFIGNEWQFFVENDSFGSTDQYYTNGLKLGFGMRGECLSNLLKLPTDGLLKRIREISGAEGGANTNFGLFIGQNLYTPRNITIAVPQPNDRPWAAWAYVGTVAQVVTDNRLHTVEVDLGMVGPPALGRQVQTFWHEQVVDAPTPAGWANQIRAEPGVLATYMHKRRYGANSGVQIVPHIGASAGTIMTLVRAGGLVRLGRHMTGFGPDGIEPGGAMLKNSRNDDKIAQGGAWEWFVFAGVDGRLVGHNIFLDGSLFRDGPSVKRRDAVYDFTAGLSMRIHRLRFSLTQVKRSPEFDSAAGRGGQQRFYSVNIGYEMR